MSKSIASLEIHEFSRTDVGLKRSHNQDAHGSVLAANGESFAARGHLFLVADGMGAHAVGELASRIAVDAVRHSYVKQREGVIAENLRRALLEANEAIHQRGLQNADFRGMGTTATALVLTADSAFVGHVGDSRCYRVRGNQIDQLSFDHSLQWELARRQRVEPEDVLDVPTNIIVRSLGPSSKVKVDIYGPHKLKEGDRFVLCSDGLSGPVSDREIWAAVTHLEGESACRFLVDLANLRGGMDNITILLVQVGSNKSVADERSLDRWPAILREIPLSGYFLTSGLMMATVGYVLSVTGVPGIVFSLLVIGLLGAGLTGLILRRRARERKALEPVPPPASVVRSKTFILDRELIDDLADAERALHESAIDEGWKVEWSEFNRARGEAREHLEAGRFPEAFRSFAESLSRLAEGMLATREKQEIFRPHFKPREENS